MSVYTWEWAKILFALRINRFNVFITEHGLPGLYDADTLFFWRVKMLVNKCDYHIGFELL
jgi:hypothetical protein